MKTIADGSNLLNRFAADRGLAAAGIKAEGVGRHAVRLSRSGRALGIWQQTIGSYAWFPAGQTTPLTSVLSAGDAVRHSSRSFVAG